MSIFGATPTPAGQTGGGLFGASNTQQQQQQPAGGLFGAPAQNTTTNPLNSAPTLPAFGNTGATNVNTGGGGLFGQTNISNTTGGGLFSAQQQPAAGGGLFGGTQTQTQPAAAGGGLFGATQTQPAGGGLFGASTQPAQPATTGGGLFGASSTTQGASQGGGLFGASTTQPATGGGLFGASNATQPTATGGGLFGAPKPQAASGGGLFGASTAAQPAAMGGGLFGASTAQPAAGGGLFGASTSTAQQPNLFGSGKPGLSLNTGATPAPTNTNPLFGGGAFGQSQAQQPAVSCQLFGQAKPSIFGQSTTPAPGSTSTNPLFGGGNSTLGISALGGSSMLGRTTTGPGQQVDAQTQHLVLQQRIEGIYNAWNPQSPQCRFQHAFYNIVDPTKVAQFQRPQNVSNELWDKARRENPNPSCFVPVFATGFDDLRARVDAQSAQSEKLKERLIDVKKRIDALSEQHALSNVSRLKRATAQQTQVIQRLLAFVKHLHLLIPAIRSSSIRPEEEQLRQQLEKVEEEIRRGRLSGKLNELWALIGAVSAMAERGRNGDGSGGEWAVVDEEGLSQIAQILSEQQAGLAHLTKVLQKTEKDLGVILATPNRAEDMAPLACFIPLDYTSKDPQSRRSPSTMRFRTLEIRWHDSKPISTCDFQPVPFKKARPSPGHEKEFAAHSYRLATGGEDNHVRMWMVHPNIRPSTLVDDDDTAGAPRPPRVEYLATLSRHSAPVNVVRFSPNGELIASAGDDGMIIIWSPSVTPQASTYGSDLTPEELQHEKEYWKPRTSFRCTTMQVYDLAWSPNGEYVLVGSTDNIARVFSVADGKALLEIAEHSHYVQGVAWDPLNEYIATQSNDRSMHIYRISTKNGVFEAHAVGKNTRMPHRHTRTPSVHGNSRPPLFRSQSIVSDTESVASEHPEKDGAPLTPATSVASSSMFPPPSVDKPTSRRSSFSSNAPGSPAQYGRYGRSPSPMPPLPAIRTQPSPTWSSVKLYGDESFSHFFRRLTFSPDGGLLMTPAGQFEDPSFIPPKVNNNHHGKDDTETPTRGRKGRPTINTDLAVPPPPTLSSTSSVYIYSRANFARPPVAQLPGHKKASVAVRFAPVLYELRPGVEGCEGPRGHESRTAALEKGIEGKVDVDVVGPVAGAEGVGTFATPQRSSSHSHTAIVAPSPRHGHVNVMASPAMSPLDLRPPTPAASKPSSPTPGHASSRANTTPTGSVIALPYRMLFAVVTMDTVAIYDTQQAGPVCLLTKLHYDEFSDLTWSPDGQCLMVSSRDGYCTLIMFDEILPAHHTQQHSIQLQSIAYHHSVPIAPSPALLPLTSPSLTPTIPRKRAEPPLTPATSVDGGEREVGSSAVHTSSASTSAPPSAPAPEPLEVNERDKVQEPPKKKRRVALTRVGDLES